MPPDDAPPSRNPRAPREPFQSVRDAAESARQEALIALMSMPPPAPTKARALPRWTWAALAALIMVVAGWLIGIR